MIQVRKVETLNLNADSRQELDRNFLHTRYRRRLLVASSSKFAWCSRPSRAQTPLTLIPIPIGQTSQVWLRFLDLDHQLQTLQLAAGRCYYLPPNIPYQLEARGLGALEIWSPPPADGRLFSEEVLPSDFFTRHAATASSSPGIKPGMNQELKECAPMATENRKPKKIDVLIINDEVETPSFLNPMSGQIFVTNPVGKKLMELADGTRNLHEISAELSRDFKGAPQAEMLSDATEFFVASAQKGLVTWTT